MRSVIEITQEVFKEMHVKYSEDIGNAEMSEICHRYAREAIDELRDRLTISVVSDRDYSDMDEIVETLKNELQ